MPDEVIEPEIKVIKITDPRWVGYLAEPIKQYVDKTAIPTIRYETLYTYFVNVVQMGGKTNELWIAYFDGDYTPIAFANWYVVSLPHLGAAEIGHLYSWNRAKVPVSLLVDQFLLFAQENRCPTYTGDIVNEQVFKVLAKTAASKGVELKKTEKINFFGARTS
jgi:hypothetical protein